jgi:adenylate cyclase
MFKDYKYVIENNDVVVISSVLMILFFTFLIVQIVSTIFMKKQLHDPLNILRQNMKKVGEGDLSSRIQVNDNDEIGSLQAYFNDMVEGLAERQKIKDIFGKFVSGEICDKLLQKGDISLDGDEVITTVMFTDIRDFTPLSEKMTPKELIQFMNRYFSYIVKPIMDENGIVNKFIGDAVMAIFSPVFDLEKHAEAALKAALKMRKALDEFNLEKKVDVKQGIGLHTGKLVVGNVGTEERMEFTVLGDNVNIAARIESQTKELKTDILMSEDFYNELELSVFDDYNFIKYENIQMKGKTDNFVLYGVEEKSDK